MTKVPQKIEDVSSESSLQCNLLLINAANVFEHQAPNTATVYQPVVACKVAQYVEKSLFHHTRAVKKHKSSDFCLCVDEPLAPPSDKSRRNISAQRKIRLFTLMSASHLVLMKGLAVVQTQQTKSVSLRAEEEQGPVGSMISPTQHLE